VDSIPTASLVLAIAASLDYLVGDPWGWPHPVQGMGWLITQFNRVAFKLSAPLAQRLAGVVLFLGLMGLSGGLGWAIARITHQIHPLLGLATESILLASCFAGRSLRDAALEVLQPLVVGDLLQARTVLSRYVGRDTAELSEPDVLRAILETVTENATDGVLAPLFYALVGGALFPGGSVALALAYKAASTLDSMVGYRTPPYTYLGWCSARTEDGLTWLPCRLAVLTIALLSGHPRRVWRICWRDAIADPSPNSGWSEGAYAAALGVQVGGRNWYQGVPRDKPHLGDPLQPITPVVIEQALALTRRCFLLWLISGIVLLNISV
jgi:adenosylcobinamide-phosphate synthase